MNRKSNQSGSRPTYDVPIPIYQAPPTHSMYGLSRLYPEVDDHGQTSVSHVGRPSPCHHTPSQSSYSGLGIRVLIKPEYLSARLFNGSLHLKDIPRSSFHFDFELERKILAGEDNSEFWSELVLKHLPAEPESSSTTSSSMNSAIDPVVSKYVASGLSREAVPIAVMNYGDNPTKVREFVKGYTLLQEMGFSPTRVAEALLMFDSDPEKALAHVLNGSTSE